MLGQWWGNVQQETGPFSPDDIANLILWLDATDPANTGVQPANGTALSQWVDKSPEGYVALQAVGAQQPIFTTNVQNGLPCVVFTAASSQTFLVFPNFECKAQSTMFVAVKQAAAGSNQFIMEQSPDAASNNGFWMYGGSFGACRRNTALVTASTGSASWLGSTFTYFYSIYNGTNLEVFLKNTLAGTGTNAGLTNNTITAQLNICSRATTSLFSSASVGEIIIYDAVLNASQIAAVGTYLTTKWGIP